MLVLHLFLAFVLLNASMVAGEWSYHVKDKTDNLKGSLDSLKGICECFGTVYNKTICSDLEKEVNVTVIYSFMNNLCKNTISTIINNIEPKEEGMSLSTDPLINNHIKDIKNTSSSSTTSTTTPRNGASDINVSSTNTDNMNTTPVVRNTPVPTLNTTLTVPPNNTTSIGTTPVPPPNKKHNGTSTVPHNNTTSIGTTPVPPPNKKHNGTSTVPHNNTTSIGTTPVPSGSSSTDSSSVGRQDLLVAGKTYSLANILWSIFLSFGAGVLIAVLAKMLYNRYRKDSYVLPPEQEMR